MKTWKRLLAALLLGCLLTCLCGCKQLDDMRKVHAVQTEDGGVTCDGVRYLPLPVNGYLFDTVHDIYVTAPDMPLLLSQLFGNYSTATDDGIFLQTAGAIYCREDRLAAAREALKDPDAVPFSVIDAEHSEILTLTEEQNAAIRAALTRTPDHSDNPYVLYGVDLYKFLFDSVSFFYKDDSDIGNLILYSLLFCENGSVLLRVGMDEKGDIVTPFTEAEAALFAPLFGGKYI